MQTKQKGDIAVAHAITYFTTMGYEVFLPIGDKRKFDMVVEKDGKCLRVQIKYAGWKARNGQFAASTRVSGGNQSFHTHKKYGLKDFDLLYVYTAKGDSYLFPWIILKPPRSQVVVDSPLYIEYKVN